MRIQFSDLNFRKVIDSPHYYVLKFIIVFASKSLLLGYSQPMAEHGRDTKAETFLKIKNSPKDFGLRTPSDFSGLPLVCTKA